MVDRYVPYSTLSVSLRKSDEAVFLLQGSDRSFRKSARAFRRDHGISPSSHTEVSKRRRRKFITNSPIPCVPLRLVGFQTLCDFVVTSDVFLGVNTSAFTASQRYQIWYWEEP